MPPTRKSLLLPLCLVAHVHAADWRAIPAEVWALKEDPAKGIKDAIVLEDRTQFTATYVERTLRVRILSEAGRRAVELPPFSEDCHGFSGRIVYPDGRAVLFDKRQDFRKESLEVGDFSEKRTIVVPPGVTGNCVVELKWDESVKREWGSPLPARMGYFESIPFGNPFLTLSQSVEVPPTFRWNYSLISGRTIKLESSEKSGFKIFTARNIEPLEQPPYSLPVSLDRPVFYAFYQPVDGKGRPPKVFWDAVGSEIWKPRFESGIRKGRQYQALRERIIPRIQTRAPQAFAAELIPILEGEILNTSHLTHEESARWKKDQEVPESKDLEEICKTRTANGEGMMILYYHLLADGGFSPKLALLADRDKTLFRESIFNLWQVSDAMLALEEPGKGMALFDPSERFASPGMIPPDYQGVTGLLVDPKAGWKSQPFSVPIQPAAFNRRVYDYALTVAEEEDRFQLTTQFSGYPEFLERRRYLASDPGEQNRSLKERMEKGLRGASITRAEVLNTVNPKENISWKVEGVLERDPGHQRQVEPFPGMPWPVHVPDSFPRERSIAIVMPYLQAHTARSTVKVPKGFRVNSVTPFERRNSLGHVSWSMKAEEKGGETVAVVTLNIGVDSMFAAPQSYEELKAFLDWVSQACRRTLILEKA